MLPMSGKLTSRKADDDGRFARLHLKPVLHWEIKWCLTFNVLSFHRDKAAMAMLSESKQLEAVSSQLAEGILATPQLAEQSPFINTSVLDFYGNPIDPSDEVFEKIPSQL